MNLLIRMLRKRLLLTIVTICISGLCVVAALWWNAQLSDIIDIISNGGVVCVNVIVWAIFTIFCISVMEYVNGYISSLTCEWMAHDLRMGYAGYFASLGLYEIECLNTGEQLSKLQNEIADVSGYINNNFFQLINDVIKFFITFGWLLILNARLTIMVNLPVIVIMIYVIYSSKIIADATERSQQAKGKMNKNADTLLTLFPIIKIYDASRIIIDNYEKQVNEWKKQTIRSERICARLLSLSGLLSNIPLALLFFIGGNMVLSGVLTIGTLYIFINLSGNVSGVMMNMPRYISVFRQFSINLKRLSPKILFKEGECKI